MSVRTSRVSDNHLTNFIKSEQDKRNFTGMVVLDLQNAFDTVDHDILGYRNLL